MALLRCALVITFLSSALFAQAFEFFPGAKYDPKIPALKGVVGHEPAERITMHHEAERYIHARDF